MFRNSFRVLAVSSLIFMTACNGGGNPNDFSNASPQLVAQPDAVSAMLADAADRASSALETLAAVEYSKSPGVSVAPIGNAPPELRRAITVNWVGPVEPITKMLAGRAGYKFAVTGNLPPVPIVVSIDVENKPIIEVLRDLGLQLGIRSDLKVDGRNRVIEISYPPNPGIGG